LLALLGRQGLKLALELRLRLGFQLLGLGLDLGRLAGQLGDLFPGGTALATIAAPSSSVVILDDLLDLAVEVAVA
jgi:hypothetical protein